MPIDFVDPSTQAQLDEAAPMSLAEGREAIFRAQREAHTAERNATRSAAAAEERAQVAAQKRIEEQQEPPSLDQVFSGRPTTIEALHAQIRLQRQPKKADPPPPAPSARQMARTELEMEAGRQASARASKAREAELAAGKTTAEGQPVTPHVIDTTTVNTPVYRPNTPTLNLDQNRPFSLKRGG